MEVKVGAAPCGQMPAASQPPEPLLPARGAAAAARRHASHAAAVRGRAAAPSMLKPSRRPHAAPLPSPPLPRTDRHHRPPQRPVRVQDLSHRGARGGPDLGAGGGGADDAGVLQPGERGGRAGSVASPVRCEFGNGAGAVWTTSAGARVLCAPQHALLFRRAAGEECRTQVRRRQGLRRVNSPRRRPLPTYTRPLLTYPRPLLTYPRPLLTYTAGRHAPTCARSPCRPCPPRPHAARAGAGRRGGQPAAVRPIRLPALPGLGGERCWGVVGCC